MAENRNYKLRCTLTGHSRDVRAVTVTPGSDIITASRDQTARLWCESGSANSSYQEKIVYKGHSGYVTSVCHIPRTDATAEEYIATGSRDSSILIFSFSSSEAQYVLSGHSDTVSSIVWKKDTLVSGSWDHTLKIWKNWECISDLKGHSGPVWSVAIIDTEVKDEPCIVSASADKTLKCWKDGKDVVTYTGHTDCVRGVIPWDKTDKFLSCSNDASVRLWKLSGECLATYYGHTNFIYSITSFTDHQGFVTCGEDRTVSTWDCKGNNVQTIYIPAQSVWTVAALPNSDIVVGSSDGVCRVFTQSDDRKADDEEVRQFEESLAKFKVAVQEVGGIKTTDLPDRTFLLQPGKRDGQTVMIRDGEKVLCYNWSSSKQQWEAVGEVVGGAGGSAASSGKVLYQGREYDYVFEVDTDEGHMLKLPYNKGEDPWMVAQSFIHQHDLPQGTLDRVANFIMTNANVSAQSYHQNVSYVDPFTGSSRYIPSASDTNAGSLGTDPFTGGGRYVPEFSSEPMEAISSQFFPQLIPLKFDSVNKEGILNKLKESNSLVTDKMTDKQIDAIVEAAISSAPEVSALAPLEMALQWPVARVWPVIDILRLAFRSSSIQETWVRGDKGSVIVGLLVGFLDRASSPPATQLLTLRCLANLAAHPPGRDALLKATHNVIGAVANLAPYENKNLEISAATLTLNYSVLLRDSKSLDDQCQVLSSAATIALSATDTEAIFRALVALGTILSTGSRVRPLAKSLDLKTIVEKHAMSDKPPKIGECARQLLRIL